MRSLQWYKRGAAYNHFREKEYQAGKGSVIYDDQALA